MRKHLINLAWLLSVLTPAFAMLYYGELQQRELESNPEIYGSEYASIPKSRMLAPILPDQRQAIALNAYQEARSDGKLGMIAVTNTVHHRMKDPEFPKTYHDVIYQPKQFSWTLSKDSIEITEESSWNTALRIADLELKGKLPDLVNGARFYANVAKVDTKRHKWVTEYTPLAKVGNHSYMDKPDYVKKHNLKPLKQPTKQAATPIAKKQTKLASI
jgi:spore germination cell wall hydrolase CwlJ-like protein